MNRFGDLVVDAPGVVLSGLDIRGSVYINASNVTLINSKVTAGGDYVIRIATGVAGTLIQNVTISGTASSPEGSKGIAGSGTFIANSISNVEDGIFLLGDKDTLIQDNYIHDLKATGSPHYDGIQIEGSVSNVTIRHNTVINDHDQTSAVMIDNYFGPISNITVDNNLLVGGGYTIYVDGQFSGGPVTGVSITNNHMGQGNWGITNFNKASPAYTGNVNDGASIAASLDEGSGTIFGTSGADTLVGTAGADTMAGGTGNDQYVVNHVGDVVSEAQGGGTDLVTASISYTLPDNVENLTLAGSGNLSGSGNALANVLTGNAGNNILDGKGGNDTLNGDSGNDRLIGGSGNDIIDGGVGIDTAVYAGVSSQYRMVAFNGAIVIGGGSDGMDQLQGVEQIAFANLTTSSFPSAYAYIASYGDLINVLGANGQAGIDHFMSYGFAEGREAGFSGIDYIAANEDLIIAFGANSEQGALHYIQYGFREGRPTNFEGLNYIASYSDLMNAFGVNDDAGAAHFVQFGFREGRHATFDGLEYIASYGDLINAFGVNDDAGASHFIEYGRFEGRSTLFDPAAYLANYSDLQAAFGNNLEAATVHFIQYGFHEGRDWF